LKKAAVTADIILRLQLTQSCRRWSIGLYTGELDHLGLLLSLCGDELAKIGGRVRRHRAAQVGKARLDVGIGGAISLLIPQ
jgi:hypothetical protein